MTFVAVVDEVYNAASAFAVVVAIVGFLVGAMRRDFRPARPSKRREAKK